MEPLTGPAQYASREQSSGARLSSTIVHALLLTGLVAAVYSSTLDVPLVFDDIFQIGANPSLRSLGAWLDAKGWVDPRFLSFLTFALDGSLHGGSLAGMHVTNIAIHLASTLLLYALVRAAFRSPALSASRIHRAGALVALGAAALFAAHPLQTQAVTYIMQRMASLATCLYLAGVVGYLRSRLSRTAVARWGWLAGSLAALLAGLFTKQNVATLPAALVLFEVTAFQGPLHRRMAWLAPHWVLTGGVATLRLSAASGAAAVGVEARSLGSVSSPLEYFFTQSRVLVEYLRMLVLPIGQNIDHAFPISRTPWEPAALGSLLVLAALGLAGLWLLVTARQRDPAWRLVGIGIGWWFITHAVESSFIPISDVMVEHRVYLPAAGFFLVLSSLAALTHQALSARRGKVRFLPGGVLAAAVLIFAGAAWARNQIWRDGQRLWRDSAAKAPLNARAHSNLGAHLLVAGDIAGAVSAYSAGVQANSSYAPALWGLSQAYAAAGQRELADRYRAEAFRLGAEHQLRLGEELMSVGAWPSAVAELDRGVRGAPFNVEMRRALGLAYLGSGEVEKAVAELERARDIAPDSRETKDALARALLRAGRPERGRALPIDADRTPIETNSRDPKAGAPSSTSRSRSVE